MKHKPKMEPVPERVEDPRETARLRKLIERREALIAEEIELSNQIRELMAELK